MKTKRRREGKNFKERNRTRVEIERNERRKNIFENDNKPKSTKHFGQIF